MDSVTAPADARADREERLRALLGEVAGPVRSYLRRRCAPDDVEEVLADVALVCWRRLDDVPPGEAALPWAYAVARRCLANHRRGGERRLRLVERVRGSAAVERPVADWPGAEPDDPPEVVALHAALARLGEVDREVVALWAWEGLAPREVAAVTGLTPNAVSVRLSRVRARLAAELALEAGAVGGARQDRGPAGQEQDEEVIP